MKEFRKTYKPLIGWMIGMCIGLAALTNLTAMFVSGALLTRLTLLGGLAALDVLMAMIYFGEYVYWINCGPTFEQARDAGSAVRKAYARAHLRAFLWGTAIAAACMIVSHIANWPIGIDIAITIAAMIVSALSTIRVKFQ